MKFFIHQFLIIKIYVFKRSSGVYRNLYKFVFLILSMVKKVMIDTKTARLIKSKKTKILKPKKLTKAELEKQLIDNFVNLQRVLTNLSIKFDGLSDQISKLLQLFEISAKSFVEKLPEGTAGKEKDKDFLNKIDTLLEQNKTIAKGLTLMEEKLREKVYGSHPKPIERMEREEKERPHFPKF